MTVGRQAGAMHSRARRRITHDLRRTAYYVARNCLVSLWLVITATRIVLRLQILVKVAAGAHLVLRVADNDQIGAHTVKTTIKLELVEDAELLVHALVLRRLQRAERLRDKVTERVFLPLGGVTRILVLIHLARTNDGNALPYERERLRHELLRRVVNPEALRISYDQRLTVLGLQTFDEHAVRCFVKLLQHGFVFLQELLDVGFVLGQVR